MAIPIQTPSVGTALQAAFGLQGRVRPYLEESIIPVVTLGDLGQGSAPYIRRHAAASWQQAAVAAEYPSIRIEAIPGTIAVITNVRAFAGAAGNFRFGFPGNAASLAAQANTAAKGFTDGRILTGAPSGAQAPASVMTFGTAAALVAPYQSLMRVQANVPQAIEPVGWVIGTGSNGLYGFLEIQFDQANNVCHGTVEWDEYSLL